MTPLKRDLTVEWRETATLEPYARNARTHDEAQVTQIANSIKEFGWTNPVLIDEQNTIIAGHGRVLAAKQLGEQRVPVIVLTGLSPSQRRAYTLADNKIALGSGWNNELLRLELGELKGMSFDLGTIGFSTIELRSLFAGGSQQDPEATPELPKDPVSRPGDLWCLGEHRLLCGDATSATDVSRLLAGAKPHLMVTDPPYGVDYDPTWRAKAGVNKNRDKQGVVQNDGRADWREAWALFPGDVAYVWHAGRYSSTVQGSIEATGFDIRSQIIWAKERFALSRGDYHWQHEPCWYAVRQGKTAHWVGGRSQSTRWDIQTRDDSGHGHGTQKPVECMKRPIANNSKAGDGVYDPFLGSGTTMIAAETTGRICYGLEISPAYCDVIVQRWQKFTGKVATIDNEGRIPTPEGVGQPAPKRGRARPKGRRKGTLAH